jgi:ribokinase
MTIVVFGSINMDLVVHKRDFIMSLNDLSLSKIVNSRDVKTAPGGRGANQALAAARLGVRTSLVGRVGVDNFGMELLANLKEAGVDISNVLVDTEHRSGIAFIQLNQEGEHQSFYWAGANGHVDEEDVQRFASLLQDVKFAMIQLGISLPIVMNAVKAANERNVPIILDPAPYKSNLPNEIYSLIDIITPNKVEAEQLVGFTVDEPASAKKAASVLLERGVGTVIITLGAQGALCSTPKETFFAPSFLVDCVDPLGAGDTFNGGLVAGLVAGLPIQQAVTWANAAAALSVTKINAQASMPDRNTFETFLRERESSIITFN